MTFMWHPSDDGPRAPRAEPEILPPEAPGPRRREADQLRVRRTIYIARPGPFAAALALILIAVLAVAGTVAIVGVALLLLPGIALGLGVLLLAALLRGPRRL